jgi:NAD-dependent deacetylase
MRKKVAILTGAGISAESGIPTFRDSNGLWEGHDIMEVASPQGWSKNPQLVLDFYNMRHKHLATVAPNAAHFGLVDLEKDFDVTIITQNVDDLHERAGSKRVVHLHGELRKKKTIAGDHTVIDWPLDEEICLGDTCEEGNQYRPHIVWFGEDVPMIWTADSIAWDADIFVVIGTSLQVYPAANLLNKCHVEIPKIILDKNIPSVFVDNLHEIKKSAVEGIEQLKEILYKLK